MALAEQHEQQPAAGPDSPASQIPAAIKARLQRGRQDMLRGAPQRRLCVRFEKGDTYWYLNKDNALRSQNVSLDPTGGKPQHRIRNTYNFIRPIVEAKISQATQRIPSYDVTASTTDPEDMGAAKLSEKVALYGYDKWALRDVSLDIVKLALAGGGEGFALPYFDPNVGPYVPVPQAGEDGAPIPDEQGQPSVEHIGLGEIKILVLSRNEVFWEPGCKYHESRWWAIERARAKDDVYEMPGYMGGALAPDASTSDVPTDRQPSDQMVLVTEYYERPCPKYPEGRRLVMAGGKVICPPEPYPLRDHEGAVLDEPLLHRLRYTHDPDSDNDFGLVWQLIDFQRTIQDCYNKLLEWKNRTLNPQMVARVGSLNQRLTDEPGAVVYYKGEQAPTWQQAPQVPEALFRIIDTALTNMRAVAADLDIQADPNVAARTVQAAIENSNARWQSFLGDLAEWHSRLMRHCLLLTARYYTEPRLLAIKGRFGPERIEDFRGAQLMGQVDVRVLPGSLDVLSKEQVQNQLSWIVANFPGYLSPEAAISALQGGTSAKLVESYELDVARVNLIISKIKDGTVMDMPTRDEQIPGPAPPPMPPQIDPLTGMPGPEMPPPPPPEMQTIPVPDWMPRDFDNLTVWKQMFADWMKTQDYDSLDEAHKHVANEVYQGILQKEAQQQQAAAAAQTAQAEQIGMGNAAKPTEPKPLPDQNTLNPSDQQPPG